MGGKIGPLITLNNPGNAKDRNEVGECFNYRPGCYRTQGVRSWVPGGLTHDSQEIAGTGPRRRQRSNTVNNYVFKWLPNGRDRVQWGRLNNLVWFASYLTGMTRPDVVGHILFQPRPKEVPQDTVICLPDPHMP